MSYKLLLDKLQKTASNSKYLVYVIIKARNQANKIIGYSLAKTHLSDKNGEELLLKKICNNLKLVIDVGANTGEWTLMAKKYSNEKCMFHLIEPGQVAVNTLRLLANSQNNIQVHELGLADENGFLNFYEEVNAGEQSSFVISEYNQNYQTRKVSVQTLDNFCFLNNIESIDFLKIDCEGFDLKVLLGASGLLKRDKIKYIQFEYGNAWKVTGSTLYAATAYLKGFGFNIWAISLNGLMEFDSNFYGEYFQYSNFFCARESMTKFYK